jgi:tRNA-specific 2-thiouridylase
MMKCCIGLSGGVDSSTTALLMKKMGYEVIGCTFRMMNSERADAAIQDAAKVADFLNIRHEVINCVADFDEFVVDHFVNSYKNGLTPNPCVMCNKFVKFKYLDEFRRSENADIMATGHYVKLIKRADGGVELRQASDKTRDQSYFLYAVDRDVWPYVEFPLGEYSKHEIRKIAKENGLHVADKSDSQDICFIPSNDYISFVKERVVGAMDGGDINREGNIVDGDGNVVGKHGGIINYTIGQRKGLGLSGGPFFVRRIDIDKNEIVVSDKNGVKADRIYLKDVKFVNDPYW